METKTKTFDAVEMSRELREKTSLLLHSMTREQRRETLRKTRARYEAEYAARVAESTSSAPANP